MLSGVFRFVLPEISTHFVLHYLPRCFCLECPLSSSRVPPWDLVRVLHFLRGPPFEPLASCSLRDLTQKVLFLVSLATARRVGELQVVSWEVSFSGSDVFLSHLPEFHAKTESKVNPLPRSFCVRSLADFVGDLPEELLLCPVRALRHYYISLVLLLFLCVLVLFLYLLALLLGLSLRTLLASFSRGFSSSSSSAGSSSVSSARSSSASRAHSVHGVAASWAFARNASLSSILAATSWSSASVFTSSSLTDVQFSSSQGFSLGPLVAVGSVV